MVFNYFDENISFNMICWGEFKLQCLNILNKKDKCSLASSALGEPARAISDLSMGERIIGIVRQDGTASVAVRALEKTGAWERISLMRHATIAAVCVGSTHVALLTEEGTLLQWNPFDLRSPQKCVASLQNKQVIQVACGDHHSLALTKDGQLFTWGQNSNGQLGLGKGQPSTLSPQPLKSLAGIPLSQISAGGDHSFALSLSGAVFGWGKNTTGQLGLGNKNDIPEPVQVTSLNCKKTVHIACGEEHTAILTKDGLVFTCGSGRYGQLGHNSLQDELRPRLVAELWGSKVTQVTCGRYHTLAFVDLQNKMYAFGRGEHGQLGNGQTNNQVIPLSVSLPKEMEKSNESGIKNIFAGANQSFAVCWSGEKQIKTVWKLDLEIADRWISSNSKSWSKSKRMITKMFSSASCINGSFLEKSSRKYYLTSEPQGGLDLSLARQFFEKLSQNEKILKEVERVVCQHLLPSLSSRPAAVEGLRVYLILPELLRVLLKQQRGTQLAISLAEAILRLHPDSLKALESSWCRIGYSFFRNLVKTFHSVSRNYLNQTRENGRSYLPSLRKTVEMLQKLYTVNHQRPSRLSDSNFHIEEINEFFEVMKQTMESMLRLPLGTCNTLHVSRQTVLQDTLRHLRSNRHDFSRPMTVKFMEEDGVDEGGVSQEFFSLLSEALIAKDTTPLEVFEESGLVWFMSDDCKADVYRDIGIIIGMALWNHHLVNIPFPLALFKKLLGRMPTLEDLEEMLPCEARCLREILDYDDETLEVLELDFTVKGQDLIANGREILVNRGNRTKFVDLYLDFVFNKSMARQFEAFAEGFLCACPTESWKMFHPDELRVLVYGEAEYVWEDLKKVAEYDGSDLVIQNFWSVLFDLSKEDKMKFLTFVYGTYRLPIGGLAKRQLCIVKVTNMDNSDEYFPQSNTCFGTLRLPNYRDISILRGKLTHAINYCDVIGMF
ncbi:probable E3 ubiquitin-protein ligase HERC4 [Engraulis encrasicolus]|uniref:probable E3 ubiquitin-protein ligase HERC4 n=1 Tax=Engraulis encrasicolus TaxID=184585 RepID=UPI002FCEF88C